MQLSHRDVIADPTVLSVNDVRLDLVPGRWAYEAEHRAAIDAAWNVLSEGNPALYNGHSYVLVDWHISDGILIGACYETDYASFLHWRQAGFPPSRAWHAFAVPALHAGCGRLLIGRMASWTVNAGRWCPPGGSLEKADVSVDGRFNLVGNMRRELAEEIGHHVDEAAFAPGWTLVISGRGLGLFRRLIEPSSANELVARFSAHLAEDPRPELDALRFVATSAELDGLDVPPFVRAYLDTATRR